MNNGLAGLLDQASYYLASSFHLRLFDNWELLMSLFAVLLALAWLISAKFSFQPERLQWLNRLLSHAKTYFLILALLIIVRASFLAPIRISSSEMQAEFKAGQIIVLEKISWGIRLPMSNRLFSYRTAKINDIIMYHHLDKSHRKIDMRIRKVLAVAGDRVLVDFKNSSASIEHNDHKTNYRFQAKTDKLDGVLAFAIPKNKLLVVTNTLRARNFSNPEYVTSDRIVGTPHTLPF